MNSIGKYSAVPISGGKPGFSKEVDVRVGGIIKILKFGRLIPDAATIYVQAFHKHKLL